MRCRSGKSAENMGKNDELANLGQLVPQSAVLRCARQVHEAWRVKRGG